MTKISKMDAAGLATYGFMWCKNQCTDRVDPKFIKEIIPTLLGFLVIYTEEAALIYTRANITSIDWPKQPGKEWIIVNWEKLEDGPKS